MFHCKRNPSHQAKSIQKNTSAVSPTITLEPLEIPHTRVASYQK